ncbi:MAG: RluA family pseudouridine synthase [Deltaproteobacteria bacterium]|nr:RluA family pseudouridine synthase [Deltaproteobacteria bacterium]
MRALETPEKTGRLSIKVGERIRERIDSYLRHMFEGFSRNRIQKWLKEGNICVNGEMVKKNYIVKEGDKIDISLSYEEPIQVEPCNVSFGIIYEDEDIVVVDKPAGIVVYPGAGREKKSIVGGLLYRGVKLSRIGAPVRCGVVHRLDKDTSGVMVLAKNEYTHLKLSQQFAEHTIDKRYIGVVYGIFKEERGTIDKSIGRHPVERKKFAIVHDKQAISHYRVLSRLKDKTVLLFRLETGRTHQIRVHMQSAGYPIVGDRIYGGKGAKREEGIKRQALHAYLLSFVHPVKRQVVTFVSPLPEDMRNLIRREK